VIEVAEEERRRGSEKKMRKIKKKGEKERKNPNMFVRGGEKKGEM
jgi:hypothetical protein